MIYETNGSIGPSWREEALVVNYLKPIYWIQIGNYLFLKQSEEEAWTACAAATTAAGKRKIYKFLRRESPIRLSGISKCKNHVYRVFRKNCVFSQFTATPPSPTLL